MEFKYLKGRDMDEFVVEGIANVFYSNRYQYEPNLYYRMNISEEDTQKEEKLRKKLTEDMKQRIKLGFSFFVAFDGDQVIGFNNHYVNDHQKENVIIEIGTTCVDPIYHGNGIGQKIYKYIEEMWEKNERIKEIKRSTWSTNERQKYLYGKNDYQLIEELHNHYGVEGINKLIFSKKVNQKKEH